MNRSSRRGGLGAALAALKTSLQWRILLLWILATLVPTLLVTTPMWSALQGQFAYSPHAAEVAAGKNLPLLIQGFDKIVDQAGPLFTGLTAGGLLMLLVSPWLTGMVVASLRARRGLGLGELVHGGLAEYWRMLRMMLWSLIPLGLALMVGGAVTGAAASNADEAVLASEVESAARIGLIVAGIVFVLAHASVEAGRGWIGARSGPARRGDGAGGREDAAPDGRAAGALERRVRGL